MLLYDNVAPSARQPIFVNVSSFELLFGRQAAEAATSQTNRNLMQYRVNSAVYNASDVFSPSLAEF